MATCRFCESTLTDKFLSLGKTPLANSYLTDETLGKMEPFYPLELYVCRECYLVQLLEFENPIKIFSIYAYFSSYSTSWVNHARQYAEHMVDTYHFTRESLVVELGSNDGYLLQFFKNNGVPVLGIEPAENIAHIAIEKGIPTEVAFFSREYSEHIRAEHQPADLIIGNNILAHVPDLNDFVAGMANLLGDSGIITMEFPHLLKLMELNQFDTIYHEHFSYFSLLAAVNVFRRHGLEIFDVEELSTHGGSLRIYAKHRGDDAHPVQPSVDNLLQNEKQSGLDRLDYYYDFGHKVRRIKREIQRFFLETKSEGKSIAGYGAPAKGNTLLNYCGIDTDYIDYTVDLNPYKQNRYLPGANIPIFHPDHIRETQPDFVFILPWNLKDEIMEQMHFIREWGGQFVLPIPRIEIIS